MRWTALALQGVPSMRRLCWRCRDNACAGGGVNGIRRSRSAAAQRLRGSDGRAMLSPMRRRHLPTSLSRWHVHTNRAWPTIDVYRHFIKLLSNLRDQSTKVLLT